MNVLGVGDEAGGPQVRLHVGNVVSLDGDDAADVRKNVELRRGKRYGRECIFGDLELSPRCLTLFDFEEDGVTLRQKQPEDQT